jgi:hypothetical protein
VGNWIGSLDGGIDELWIFSATECFSRSVRFPCFPCECFEVRRSSGGFDMALPVRPDFHDHERKGGTTSGVQLTQGRHSTEGRPLVNTPILRIQSAPHIDPQTPRDFLKFFGGNVPALDLRLSDPSGGVMIELFEDLF